jgi:hypothetical protein
MLLAAFPAALLCIEIPPAAEGNEQPSDQSDQEVLQEHTTAAILQAMIPPGEVRELVCCLALRPLPIQC